MIRNIEAKDIEEVVNLGIKVNQDFKKLFDLLSIIQTDTDHIYVYEKNNKIVGFIHIQLLYEVMDIINIVVLEEYRHNGVASNLMDYVISEHNEIKKVMLEVNEGNDIAIKLYSKFGFKIINKRRNYYNNENALVMERVI